MFVANRKQIVAAITKIRLPAIYASLEDADAGGLVSYGPDVRDGFRRAAGYVAKILKGAKPADLPFEQAAKFHLAVNLKTAKDLGIVVPQSILLRADKVIE
jgi:putative tryptophan/tyrosine transport system substrate-binding protein